MPTSSEDRKAAAAKAAILKRNPDGVHRSARASTCRHCRAPTFIGLDDDRCAHTARIDVVPLSAAGELMALMMGRPTYSLTWYSGRGRYEIDRRDHYAIETFPPGEHVNVDVVTGHECNSPQLPRLLTMIRRNTLKNSIPIEPPF